MAPPPIVFVDKFTTSMFTHATCGSFEFKNLTEEEFKKILNNRKIESYIHDPEIIELLNETLDRNIKESKYYTGFYSGEDFILIQKFALPWIRRDSDDNLIEQKLNYFYCEVFTNAFRYTYTYSTAHPPRNSIR